MEPIEKLKAVVEIAAIACGAVVTYWAYDSQLDGQMTAHLTPFWERARSQARSVLGAFLDGRAVVGWAEEYCRRPLPPRGPAWPDRDDR